MDSIDDHSTARQTECCPWEKGYEQRHDEWLGKLQRFTNVDRHALISEWEIQSRTVTLPEWAIPMIDIADFAKYPSHTDISDHAIKVAEILSDMASDFHRRSLRLVASGADISIGG